MDGIRMTSKLSIAGRFGDFGSERRSSHPQMGENDLRKITIDETWLKKRYQQTCMRSCERCS